MGSPLIIRNTQSPGDIVVLSAAIRDLAIRHPGKYNVDMTVSPGSEHIFWNNPYVRSASPILKTGNGKAQTFVAQYPLIHQSNQAKKHFIWGFIEHMNSKLKTDIKLTDFRPDIHLSPDEITRPIVEPPYWLFLSGGKTDFATKIWARSYWEEVIGSTYGDIHWVQCGGGSKNHIMHEKIKNVQTYMVKQTSLRDFIKLIYHADGVVCGVTAAMHIAAAFNKPCVVIAGGREPWWWEAYNNENRLFNMRVGDPTWQIPVGDTYVEHKYLHTQDQLPCCMGKGCWKSKLTGKNAKCQNIVTVGKQSLPKCLAMIKPEQVIDSILSYYKDDIIDRQLTFTPKANLPEHVYGLFGRNVAWKDKLTAMIKACDASEVVSPTETDRLSAIKSLAKNASGHLFWFEDGTVVESAYWLRMIFNAIAPSTVCGRIYRTQDGQLYPHPGFFIAPAQKLNMEAKTYPELFNKIQRDQFMAVGADVRIPITKP